MTTTLIVRTRRFSFACVTIETLEIGQFEYLEMYGGHLEKKDWITRAMAVISLGRIDDPRTSEKLLQVAWQDRRAIVRVFAWEALHARTESLSDEQRQCWLERGWALARKGAMRGSLRVGLLGLMGSAEPTSAARKAFMSIFANTNLLYPSDMPTLWAMQQVVSDWRDPQIIKALIKAMGDINNAYRAEYLLGGLDSGVPAAASLSDLGSQAMWQQTQLAWAAWLKRTRPTAATADKLKAYTDTSDLLPPAEKITNPGAKKWRKDLELGRLHLDELDVAFAVDSTGSMTQVVGWIKRDVTKMMRAFGMISRKPRIGIVFYRDHGDAYVVQVHRLTDRDDRLTRAIGAATAKGGGDVPEAVYEALRATVKRQRWSRRKQACKVVVLIGDAAPHEKTMERIRKLVQGSAEKGFRFYCIKARTRYGSADLSSFDQIANWGNGRSIAVSFPGGSRGGAVGGGAEEPYRQIIREVLQSILTQAYHDRAEAFVNVLMEYLELPVPETRQHFGPRSRTPPPPRRPGPPRPPPKPYDPQAR